MDLINCDVKDSRNYGHDASLHRPKLGHTGVCKCRICGKTNPWRSDFKYGVARSDGEYQANTAIWPGFLGRCRFCDSNEIQDVVRVTDTIEEAIAQADAAP